MASSKTSQRIVVDNIHGDIALTEREWALVNTASFQRLRRIKQLGMGHLTYPNATHTRFAHSLGVLGIMSRILKRWESEGGELKEADRDSLRHAALLHDIGHYPYSHLVERIDSVVLTEEVIGLKPRQVTASRKPYPDHEEVGQEILKSQSDLLDILGGTQRAEDIGNLFSRTTAANQQLSKLIHSSLDMDRMDYLMRDARAAGVPYGEIDLNYLLNNLRISPQGFVGVEFKAIAAAEHFLLARLFMHRTVYYHKTTYAFEEACRQLLRRLRDEGNAVIPADGDAVLAKIRSRDLLDFTDDFIDKIIRDAESNTKDPVARVLASSITNRRPPKLLAEVSGLQRKDDTYNAGTFFWSRCVDRLAGLAKKYDLQLGQFLLCRAKPVKVEERGPLLSREELEKLEPEEREELIKVFEPGGDEPKSLIEIKSTVVRELSQHVFGICRLYLAGSEQCVKDGRLPKIAQEVQAWLR